MQTRILIKHKHIQQRKIIKVDQQRQQGINQQGNIINQVSTDQQGNLVPQQSQNEGTSGDDDKKSAIENLLSNNLCLVSSFKV